VPHQYRRHCRDVLRNGVGPSVRHGPCLTSAIPRGGFGQPAIPRQPSSLYRIANSAGWHGVISMIPFQGLRQGRCSHPKRPPRQIKHREQNDRERGERLRPCTPGWRPAGADRRLPNRILSPEEAGQPSMRGPRPAHSTSFHEVAWRLAFTRMPRLRIRSRAAAGAAKCEEIAPTLVRRCQVSAYPLPIIVPA